MILTRLRLPFFDKRVESFVLSSLFTLASDSAIYLAGVLMIGLGNFVLLPLYTRYLSPAEFGVYSLVDITILVLVTVTQLGLGVSYLKWFADLGGTQRGTILGSTLITGSLAAFVGGGLLAIVVASPLGERWLQIPERSFAWTLLPIVVLENVQGLLLTDLRARRKAAIFSAAALIRLLAIVGASLWFIAAQRQGLNGIFWGRLFGNSLGVLVILAPAFLAGHLRVAWPIAAAMLRYGLPLTWSALMAMMLDASGRYFLSLYSTMEQIGLYGVAIKISNVFQMLVNQPFGIAWGGLMFQIAKQPNARFVYSKILSYLLVVSLSAALLFVLFTPLLFSIFATDSYAAATAVFPFVLLVRAVQVMEYPTAVGIYLSGRTKHFALIYTIGLASNIAANYVVTPAYGMFGAAWAWLIAWMLITSLMLWVGHRYYPLDYYWKLALIPVTLWVLVLFNVWWLLPVLSVHLLVQLLLAFILIASVGLLLISDIRVGRKKIAEEKPV